MREADERLNIRINAYLDGEMSEEERQDFERFLAINPGVNTFVHRLRNQKKLLEKKETLPENPWFWTRLSIALPREPSRGRGWFPRFAVALVFTATALAVAVTGYLSLDTPFVSAPSRNAGGVAPEGIVPVFSSLNTDDVLRFALSGVVPLGKESSAILTVEQEGGEKYHLNLIRSRKRKPAAAVTAEQFYREINATPAQHRRIDSLLEEARKQLESSIFLAENNTLAIRPRLVGLNREVVADISRSLQPAQARRFNRLLRRLNPSQGLFVSVGQYQQEERAAPPSWESEPEDHFLVITPAMRGVRRLRIVPSRLNSRTRIAPAEVVERRLRLLFEGRENDNLPGAGKTRTRPNTEAFSVSVSSDDGTLRISIERGGDGTTRIRRNQPVNSRSPRTKASRGTVLERPDRSTRDMEDMFLKFRAEKESLLRRLERQQRYLDSLLESLPDSRRPHWRFFFKIDSVGFTTPRFRRDRQVPDTTRFTIPSPPSPAQGIDI